MVISNEEGRVSQGQMQLLTIARAMLANPALMIFDEATSSVTPKPNWKSGKRWFRA